MLLNRATLPDCGPYIAFYELDQPLEVVGSVSRQVDRSRLFMEMPMDVYAGICWLTGRKTHPFELYGDSQFVLSPAPVEEEPEENDLEPIDYESLAMQELADLFTDSTLPSDGKLSDLAEGLQRWCDALRDVDPSDAYDRLGFVYPEPALSGVEIKYDLIETVSWLADRVRQVIDRNGAIAISGI